MLPATLVSYLLVFLHGGVELLREVVGDVGHPRFLLVGPAQAAFVLARLFVVLLFGVLAVAFCGLWKNKHLHWLGDIWDAAMRQCVCVCVVLTSVLSLQVLFSSRFLSSSSCSSSLMLSSRTLGQKSPSKYGSSLALVNRSSVACLKMS